MDKTTSTFGVGPEKLEEVNCVASDVSYYDKGPLMQLLSSHMMQTLSQQLKIIMIKRLMQLLSSHKMQTKQRFKDSCKQGIKQIDNNHWENYVGLRTLFSLLHYR